MWGITNEEKAKLEYKLQARNCHRDLDIDNTGLHINPKFPHLGASPDGLLSCSCCGKGVLEIKCPFSVRNSTPCNATYLEPAESGDKLKRSHNYLYQVQGQLALKEGIVTLLYGLHTDFMWNVFIQSQIFLERCVKS